MNEDLKDEGVIAVLLERFNSQRLPRALALEEKVNRGEVLSESDIAFLEEVFADSKHVLPLVAKRSELHSLASRGVRLYKEIMEKALENEKKAG